MGLGFHRPTWEGAKKVWAQPSEGFGDTVAKITKSFGIEPCEGCERRRKAFNRAISYRKWRIRIENIKNKMRNPFGNKQK